jgi:Do/DeqQ family serine protease
LPVPTLVLRKFWLLFAQACTLTVAALFVVSSLRPDLVPRLAGAPAANVVTVREAAPTTAPVAAVASYAEAARKAMPAVVNVYTSKAVRTPLADDEMLRRYFPDLARSKPTQRTRSLGSGVIVAPEGYVLTNFHVVEGADDIVIQLADGREIQAKVRGADPESDLVVLKTEGDVANLPAITLGDLDKVHVGDVVLAIGNPFGFGNTVTSGIVSALGRNHLGINRFEDFIQTDAPINPGNSGGALVDTAGNLIGINSTIYSESGGSMGIGFAIPVSLARNVLEQIIAHGEVTRGWLGIEPEELTPELAHVANVPPTDGVLVRGLQPDGPAEKAGMQVRDVVLEIGGRSTRDVPSLLARIAELTPGSDAKVKVWRDAKAVDLDVVVGKRPRIQDQ